MTQAAFPESPKIEEIEPLELKPVARTVSSLTLTVAPPSTRLLSLDALRGFDMFWILGGEGLVHAIFKLWPQTTLGILDSQLDHKPWQGLAAYDLIFPTFVFVVGVSLVFSLSKLIETRGKGTAVRRVIQRGVVLYVLGLLYYGGISHGMANLRLMGVLQRIALAYLFAGVMFCFVRPRTLVLVCVGLLVSYWALLSFVSVPGIGHASFQEGKNLANWIDSRFLPFYKWDGNHDPEGLLSTLPAIATCLLGIFAGLLLRATRPAPWQKVLTLLLVGAAGVALGFYWGDQLPHTHVRAPWRFPVIKKIWTSSYVLAAAGYSTIALGLFYLVLDVWKVRIWAAPFIWIGVNPITLYLIERFVNYEKLAQLFVGDGNRTMLTPSAHSIAASVIAVAIMLSIARFFYKRQVFIRV